MCHLIWAFSLSDAAASFPRECAELDFSTLPDPFGAYVFKLNPSDIVEPVKEAQVLGHKADVGLGHIENPEMLSLMEREITR